MLPVVRGVRETERQIVVYTVVLTAVTLLPFAWGTFGLVYALAAVALGGAFLALALRLGREPSRRRASLLFHYSLGYLALHYTSRLTFTDAEQQRLEIAGEHVAGALEKLTAGGTPGPSPMSPATSTAPVPPSGSTRR